MQTNASASIGEPASRLAPRSLLPAALALAATLLAALAVPAPAAAQDARFRVYGPLTINGHAYAHRWGDSEPAYAPGAVFSADHISVGTIDNRAIGPYAGLDVAEVWKRWTFLRRSNTATLDAPLYRFVAQRLGARPGQLYQEDVLRAQINAERPYLARVIESFVRSQRTSPQGAFVNAPLLFEVANEPNVFPYLSPDLYAWYYLSWRKEILAAVAAFNAGRAPSQHVRAEIMPAGLWTFEGLPVAVLRSLQVSIELAGMRLTPVIETSTRRYYEAFTAAIRSERYAALGSGTYRTQTTTIRIPFLGTYTTTRRVFVPALATDLIDRGALHFYPYVGRHASWGEGNLAPHFAHLRDLARVVGASAKSGKVQLTELGSMTAYDDARAARDVVDPVLSHLKSGAIPELEAWYWFKAQGDDTKFRLLGGLRGMGGGQAASSLLSALRLLEATRLFRVNSTLTPADFRALDELTDDFRRQTPVQGLTDQNGNLREIGRVFERLAR